MHDQRAEQSVQPTAFRVPTQDELREQTGAPTPEEVEVMNELFCHLHGDGISAGSEHYTHTFEARPLSVVPKFRRFRRVELRFGDEITFNGRLWRVVAARPHGWRRQAVEIAPVGSAVFAPATAR